MSEDHPNDLTNSQSPSHNVAPNSRQEMVAQLLAEIGISNGTVLDAVRKVKLPDNLSQESINQAIRHWLDMTNETLPIHSAVASNEDDASLIKEQCDTVSIHQDTSANQDADATHEEFTFESDGSAFRLGDYQIIEEIAKGGMGVVYKARQTKLNRTVALKMIRSAELADMEQVRRFYTEAEAAGKLAHPGIVPVFDVGEANGQHYFSMAFVDGESLSERVKRDGPLLPQEAALLMKDASEAVHFAHQSNVVHRDIKPQNIMVSQEGRVQITDFGLAKLQQDGNELTADGQVLGTPAYMPPEQAAGKMEQVDARADIYSLGATLYFLLTGRPPFQAATIHDTLRQVIYNEAVPPRKLNLSVPLDLETIVLKCLEKDQHARYSSANELSCELNRYLQGVPIVARPVGPMQKVAKWCKRNPVVASLIFIANAFLIATVLISLALWDNSHQSLLREIADGKVIRQSLADLQKAKEEETSQRMRAEGALQASEYSLYLKRVTLAHQLWRENDVQRARELLVQCPDYLRSWEWHFLWAELNRHLIDVRVPGAKSAAWISTNEWIVLTKDSQVQNWSLEDGIRQQVNVSAFLQHESRLSQRPTSKETLVFDSTGGIRVFDTWSGELRVLGSAGDSTIFAECVGEQGNILTATKADQNAPIELELWDRSSGRRIDQATPTEVTGHIALAGGESVAVFANDGLWIIDLAEQSFGSHRMVVEGELESLRGAAISADGRYVAFAESSDRIRVIDLDDQTQSFHVDLFGSAQQFEFCPVVERNEIAVVGTDQVIRTYSLKTRSLKKEFPGHDRRIVSIDYNPTGTRLLSLDQTGRMRVVDTQSLAVDPGLGKGLTLAASSVWRSRMNSSASMAALGGPGKIRVTDLASNKLLLQSPIEGDVRSIGFSNSNEVVAVGSSEGEVYVWNLLNKQLEFRRAISDFWVWGTCVSPDGSKIAVASSNGVTILETDSGEVVTTEVRPTNHVFGELEFDSTGRFIAIASSNFGKGDEVVAILNAETGEVLHELQTESRSAISVKFSPDGERLIVIDSERNFQLHDVLSGSLLYARRGKVIGPNLQTRYSCDFHPSGNRFVVANGNLIRLFDTPSGEEIMVLRGDTSGIKCVNFLDGGERLAVVTGSFRTLLFDTSLTDSDRLIDGSNVDASKVHEIASPPIHVEFRVFNQEDSKRNGLSSSSHLTFPIRRGDLAQIKVTTGEPKFVYVIWISEGRAIPLSPWEPESWNLPDEPEELTSEYFLPGESSAAPFQVGNGSPFIDTILIMTRTERLPRDLDLKALLTGLDDPPSVDVPIAIMQNGNPLPVLQSVSNMADVGRIEKFQNDVHQRLRSYFTDVVLLSFIVDADAGTSDASDN